MARLIAKLDLRTGSEGPAHDPYGFTERVVTYTDGRTVTLHEGLASWVAVDPEPVRGRSYTYRLAGPTDGDVYARAMFERATRGLSVMMFDRAVWKRQESCRACGSGRTAWVDGMPGETLLVCQSCQAVIEAMFDEGAVR